VPKYEQAKSDNNKAQLNVDKHTIVVYCVEKLQPESCAEGQAIVENNKYISAESGAPFAGSTVKGKVVVSGSTSVAPLMEKLAEAYQAINPNAEIEVHHLGSTAGMTNTIEGVCDIGMASRELKDSEKEAGLNPVVIALDGIAVIVHKTNGIKNLTMDQVRAIYMGELTHWSETK